jgi:hypothetical protein
MRIDQEDACPTSSAANNTGVRDGLKLADTLMFIAGAQRAVTP